MRMKVVKENSLIVIDNSPNVIIYLGLSDSISYSKVLVRRSTTETYRIEGGSVVKKYTSALFCGLATGVLLPPYIIYKAKRMFQDWCLGGPTGSG